MAEIIVFKVRIRRLSLAILIFSVYNLSVMKQAAHKRINITLPESTVTLLESVADKGSRSTFIDTAIRIHASNLQKETLSERIKEGAIARAERNLKMAEEWFHLEEELWQD